MNLIRIILSLLFLTFFYYTNAQNGPGGVGTTDGLSTLELWLKADSGVEEDNADAAEVGDTVVFWRDLSGNTNDFSNDYGSAPAYNYSDGRYVVDFSSGSAYLRASSFFSGTGARTVIIVTQPTSLSGASANNCAFQLAPNEAAGKGYSVFLEDPSGSTGLSCRVQGNRVMDYTTSTSIPTIISIQNGSAENVTSTDFFANGTAITTQLAAGAAALNTSNLGSIIGGFSSGPDNLPETIYDYNGDISEIIVFSNELSNADRNSIESYLNIRYGITIPVASHNYYSQAAFPNDIAGIGKESTQSFTKDSAWSVNPTSILTVYNSTSLDDGDYLVWGHDGNPTSYSYSDIPASINFRTERIWRASETGETGNVDLKFYVPGLRNCGSALNATDIELLVDNIDTDFSDATSHVASTYANDTIYFTGINIANNDHFTIGIKNLDRPGDINDNLVLWLKADCGVEEDALDNAEIGDTVVNWLDQSGLGNDLTNDYGLAPDYTSVGGFPVVDFSAGASYLRGPSVLSGNTARTMIVVAQPTSLSGTTANNCVFSLSSNNGAGEGYQLCFEAPDAANNTGLALRVSGNRVMNYTTSTTEPTLIQTSGAAGINVSATDFYANGQLLTDQLALSDNTLNTDASGVTAGGFDNDGDFIPETAYDYNGYIHEVIVFDREITCIERKQIEFYLEDKYGITLDLFDESATGSNGIQTDITGILKRFGSFADVTSVSSGGLNLSNVSFLTDAGDALYVAHNGALGLNTTDFPGAIDSRISRIWYGDYSSCNANTGNVTLSFDLSGLECTSGSPAVAANYRLMTSATTTFSGASLISGATIVGSAIEFTVDVSSIQDLFFTLGTTDESTSSLWYPIGAPANISSGLQLWLKSDCGVEEAAGDGAEAGDGIAFWRDLSGNGNDAFSDLGLGSEPIYTDNAGIKGVDFSAGLSYLFGPPVITGTTGRTVIAVLNTNSLAAGNGNAAFGLAPNVTASSGSGYGLSLESPAGTNGLSVRVSGNKVMNYSVATGTPVIISTQADNNEDVTDIDFFVDGESVVVAQSSAAAALNTTNLGMILGGWSTDGDLIPEVSWDYDGELMELIVYDRELTCDEREQIEDYLATKYSINLFYEEAENIGDNGINTDPILIEEGSTSATSSAATITDVSYLTDCIDSLWIAHDNASGVTLKVDDADMSGLAGTDVRRWTRMWYALMVSNDANLGNISVTFDLDDYPSNALVAGANYRIITSASPWSYAATISGPTINVGNNTVSFVVDADVLNKKKFTLATTDEGVSPLPIALLNFEVKANNNTVDLVWTTLTEINNDYFTIEKSTNLIDWSMVSEMKGAGNSNKSINYKTSDLNPFMGISYYRLKQTDFDGKYSYSDIKKISFNSDNKIVLYPNIFNNQFTIEGNNIESREINIFNLIGQDVKHFTKQTKTSDSQIVIDAINLSTGFYYVKVDNNTFKVYKQ
jgi:Secretion system C-terminal sorting domain